MNAKELRIGNWVDWDGRLTQIKEGSDIDYYINKGVKPIPLTEEWLVKFGSPKSVSAIGLIPRTKLPYKNYKTLNIKNNKETWLYSLDEKLLMIFTDYKSRLGGNYEMERCLKIQYVHSLQNLYFALTGEEL
ncbi:MAG: hypothetical protein OEY89_01405 [Gammaproteobacteria bacterium]|nr:hypothetical protein [Gammaproteobacteria bacterium]